MSLRNKKTGEIKKICKENICLSFGDCNKVYYSLKELNDEWEDYTPTEPLIKDEKIRKAVRAWYDSLRAVMCDGKITFYDDEAYRMFQIDIWNKYSTINNTRAIAEIDLLFDCYDLDDSKTYTITELCGEDE